MKKEEKLELVNYRDGDPNPGSARDPIIDNDGAYASNAPLNHDKAKDRGNAYTTAREEEE